MFSVGYVTLFALAVVALVCSGEVIQLDTKNFEHLTQAASGATTGDWLIKFYAPWCGHCRKMEPTYEKVAEMLHGEVNVARVDVPANRELGTRFDVKGFPTIKFLSKGKVYDYVGRRTAEDLVEFAKGGYQIQQPQDIMPAMGMFGEIAAVFRHAYKQAAVDLKAGNFFTIDVFLSFMPLLFIAFVVMIMVIPAPQPPQAPAVKRSASRDPDARSSDAAPATSESDIPSKKED
jgi:protein disulfide-isomerase-like protein